MKLLIKYGGSAMGSGDAGLAEEVAALQAAGHAVVLVHGGGPEIDSALLERGLASHRIEGLRVTDEASLQVAEAVLCATANKRLVRACLQHGVPAIGISGEDGGLVKCRRARSSAGEDLGYVGEVTSVDPKPLHALLEAGYVPVVAPMAVDETFTHAYNVNADTTAGAIGAALHADAFVILTNVERVLRDPADPKSGIDRFTVAEGSAFADSPACATGMKPKMLAALAAVRGGAKRAYICVAKPGAIGSALAGEATLIE